jgi:hypothetical protein
MVSRISFLFLCTCLASVQAFSQPMQLDENKAEPVNGIDYGYYIKNEQVKNVKDEEYSRFEITFYASNKSGCTKLYAERTALLSSESSSLLALFNCLNANGKRLTSKSGSIRARDFLVNVKVQENGKEINRSARAGYIFRNGETLSVNIIVLVPKGERPKIQCTINNLPEL